MTLTRSAIDSLPTHCGHAPRLQTRCPVHARRLSAHPVTRAIRDDALRLDPPDWTAGHAALGRLASLLSGALIRVITDRSLPSSPRRAGDRARPALDRVFGINLAHHFLHAAPLEWLQAARLTEPQVTKGLAHFLNADGRATRTERIRALLRTLGSEPEKPTAASGKVRVTPEAPANGRRIDLLIEWTDASNHNRGAIIEAKFEHHVTRPATARLSQASQTYREQLPARGPRRRTGPSLALHRFPTP